MEKIENNSRPAARLRWLLVHFVRDLLTMEELQALVHSQVIDEPTLCLLRWCRQAKMTAFVAPPSCELHRNPLQHPEVPLRLQVIRQRVMKTFPEIHFVGTVGSSSSTSSSLQREQLERFHSRKYLDKLHSIMAQVAQANKHNTTRTSAMDSNPPTALKDDADLSWYQFDEDTFVMHGTSRAAMVACGCVLHAIDLVMQSSSATALAPSFAIPPIRNAFCAVRPPGHHAEPDKAMGFCLLNNVGIGTCYLLQQYAKEIQRVLIVDFDVHHGNGTQAKFRLMPQVQFISTHQSQFFPFTGFQDEHGEYGNIWNFPLPAGTTSYQYRKVFLTKILPIVHAFKPQFILVSAGFDGHSLDPLANWHLKSRDYYWITKKITQLAWMYAQGRVVSVLEGGYHLDALAESATEHVRALVDGSMENPHIRLDQPPHHLDEEVTKLTASMGGFVMEDNYQAVNSTQDVGLLRLVVHDTSGKDKMIVLKQRKLATLLKQVQNKFQFKKKKRICLRDSHGQVLDDATLQRLPQDHHLYVS